MDLHGMAAGTYELLVQASVSQHSTPGENTDSGTLTVSPAPLTISADSHAKVYGDPMPAFSVSYAGFVNGDTPSGLSGQLTFTGADQASPAGIYAVTPGGLSSPNYTITFVPGSLTVTPAPLTITVADGAKLYGDPTSFSVSYAGFVLDEEPAVLSGTLTFSGADQSSPVAGSPYAVAAGGLTSPNYAITYVSGTLTVNPAPLTVTADVIATVYGQAPAFSASYSGFVLGETPPVLAGTLAFTSDAGAAAPVSGSPYTITPSGLTSTNYAITYVPGEDIVSPAQLTLTPANVRQVVYGASSVTLSAKLVALPPSTAVVTQGQAILTVLDANGQAVGSPVTATVSNGQAGGTFPLDAGVGAGSYTIQATYSDTLPVPNFASVASATSATFTVLPAPLTITADDKTTIYGAPLPAFTATYTGAVFGQTLAALSGSLTLTSPATSLSPVSGSPYTITPGGLSSPDYAITYVTGKLTVKPADTAVRSSSVSVVYGSASVTVQAMVSAKVPSEALVGEGQVGFIVADSSGNVIAAAVSGMVSGGGATASIPLPATAYGGTYSVQPVFFDRAGGNFNASVGTSVTLTIENPVPSIGQLSEPSVAAGAGGTLTIIGSGFTPASVVQFGQAPVATTFSSTSQLSAAIPASLDVGAYDLTIFNGSPGGGTSNPVAFFLTQPGVLATVASGTSTATSGVAGVTVGGSQPYAAGSVTGLAYGAGTLTLAQYSAMPIATPVFGPEGGWFDIHVSPGSSFSVVVVTTCNIGAGHAVFWWTGSAWQRMSNQAWNASTGCITIRFDSTTSPTIAQLNGTDAEVWGWAQGIGLDPCIGFQFEGAFGRLPQSLDELDSWGNSTGLRDSSGNWSCSPTLAAPQSPPPTDGAFQRSNDGRVIPDWDSSDSEIRSVGYPGPYDRGSQEIAAYERACLCTLIPYTPPPPVVCSSGYYMTINGPRTVDQMRSELHGAGYPNWYWAAEDEIVSVYARTSKGAITLCAQGDPQPGPATPTPTPQPDPSQLLSLPGGLGPLPPPWCSILQVVGGILVGSYGGSFYNCGQNGATQAEATATAQAQATATAEAQATPTPTPQATSCSAAIYGNGLGSGNSNWLVEVGSNQPIQAVNGSISWVNVTDIEDGRVPVRSGDVDVSRAGNNERTMSYYSDIVSTGPGEMLAQLTVSVISNSASSSVHRLEQFLCAMRSERLCGP